MPNTITLRTTKGAPLSYAELDGNFEAVSRLFDVATAEALRTAAVPSTPEALALTKGALTTTDQGGGFWRWEADSTATHNTAMVIRPSALSASDPGRWLRIPPDERLNCRWWGAQGDGVTDDAAAIQAAIDYSQSLDARPPVFLPSGIYQTTVSLEINKDGVRFSGETTARESDVIGSVGTVIRYTGNQWAMRIVGDLPDLASVKYLDNVCVENFSIVTTSTAAGAVPFAVRGLAVVYVAQSVFRNINIRCAATSPNTLIGMFVAATITTTFEYIDIAMDGISYTGTCAHFGEGLSGTPSTVSVIKSCYFHYASVGADVGPYYNFYDCVFEACHTGVLCTTTPSKPSRVQFFRCWWEAIFTRAVKLAGPEITIENSIINILDRQVFFDVTNAIGRLLIRNTTFVTSYGIDPDDGVTIVDAALLLTPGMVFAPSSENYIRFEHCSFPKQLSIGGASYDQRVSWPRVQITSQTVETYRFVAAGVSPSTGNVQMQRMDGGGTDYIMPDRGNIIEVRSWHNDGTGASTGAFNNVLEVGTLSGGTVTYKTPQSLYYPHWPANTTRTVEIHRRDLLGGWYVTDPATECVPRVDVGQYLRCSAWTNSLPSGNIYVEVRIAHGHDGRRT